MATGPEVTSGRPASGVTVVLVEEHPVLRQQFARQLGDAGVQVVAAVDTVHTGLDAVLDLRPDVAVIGNPLPDGRGIDLCRALREALPQLVVLLHTAMVTRLEELEAMDAGAAAVIPKGIRGAALVAAVVAHSGAA